jgi:hypothetical protein
MSEPLAEVPNWEEIYIFGTLYKKKSFRVSAGLVVFTAVKARTAV